jgi:hypothetical protein
VDVVRCLVKELGVNVEEIFEGRPPLYAAAQEGNAEVVKCLIKDLGADIN